MCGIIYLVVCFSPQLKEFLQTRLLLGILKVKNLWCESCYFFFFFSFPIMNCKKTKSDKKPSDDCLLSPPFPRPPYPPRKKVLQTHLAYGSAGLLAAVVVGHARGRHGVLAQPFRRPSDEPSRQGDSNSDGNWRQTNAMHDRGVP